jgi:hypothetical protein
LRDARAATSTPAWTRMCPASNRGFKSHSLRRSLPVPVGRDLAGALQPRPVVVSPTSPTGDKPARTPPATPEHTLRSGVVTSRGSTAPPGIPAAPLAFPPYDR